MSSMKILYAGSPEASALTLKILLEKSAECGFEIAGVLSNPPSAKGRHKELTPTAVAAFAQEKGIPVFTPEHLDSTVRDAILPLCCEMLVCFAYGHIFGPKFLGMFKYGGINLHPSLLPHYRGSTPVNAAILNGDKETAATIQTLGLKMDEGDIVAQEKIALSGTETAESLLNYAAERGAYLICDVLKKVCDEKENLVCEKDGVNQLNFGKKQEGTSSYTGMIKKEDGKINWNDSAKKIEAAVRAFYPEPGCFCIEKGLSLRILKSAVSKKSDSQYESAAVGTVVEFDKSEGILIKTGNGLLCVKELQRQGKKAMNYKDFMNGARDFTGTVLQ